jgi:hypothetical protein
MKAKELGRSSSRCDNDEQTLIWYGGHWDLESDARLARAPRLITQNSGPTSLPLLKDEMGCKLLKLIKKQAKKQLTKV